LLFTAVLSVIASGQDTPQPPLSPGFNGHFSAHHALYFVDSNRDHMTLRLWKIREGNNAEQCHLTFRLEAYRQPAIHAGGQGAIPCSAVLFKADSATMEINLSQLPPTFIVWEGTAGWLKVRWEENYILTSQTTGTRHLTEGGASSHLNGTISFFSARAFANYNGLEIDPAYNYTGITEYKQTQKVTD
jgi:hypothetical protein